MTFKRRHVLLEKDKRYIVGMKNPRGGGYTMKMRVINKSGTSYRPTVVKKYRTASALDKGIEERKKRYR